MPSPKQLIEQAKKDMAKGQQSAPINVPPRNNPGRGIDLDASPLTGQRFPLPSPNPEDNALLNARPAEELLDPAPEGDIGASPIPGMGLPPDAAAFLASPQIGEGDDLNPPLESEAIATPPGTFPMWQNMGTSPEEADQLFAARESNAQRGMKAASRYTELYEPPMLPVSDDDVLRFMECIRTNRFYSETLRKGDISITFRVKSANELDFQRANLTRMMAMGSFYLIADYQDAISRFNLLLQVQAFNGTTYPRVIIPARPWKPEQLNLDQQYWASPLAKMNEAILFVINGMMVQFENKVYAIEQKILDPGFTQPGSLT